MAYELFVNRGARTGWIEPAVGITKTGRFNMNKPLTQLLRSKKAQFVLLFWDPDHRRIGIKPSGKDNRAYQVAYNERDNGSGFHGTHFLQHIGFDNSVVRRLFVEYNEKDGMFEIQVPAEFLSKPKGAAKGKG